VAVPENFAISNAAIFFSWNWPFINSTASLFCPPEVAHSRAAQIIFLPIHIPTFSWAKMAIAPFWLVCFIVRLLAAFNQNKCINHLSKQIKYCIHSTKWLFSHFLVYLRKCCINNVLILWLHRCIYPPFLSFHFSYDALHCLWIQCAPAFVASIWADLPMELSPLQLH
jgi:hypothetical protein